MLLLFQLLVVFLRAVDCRRYISIAMQPLCTS